MNIDTQFLGRAEESFQDGRSRILKYFAISNKICDMKTTLILNREYKRLPSAKKNIWEIFATFSFSKVTWNSADAGIKLPCMLIRKTNDEICVKMMARYRFLFLLVCFFFLSSVIKFDKKCANSTQRSQSSKP